MKRKVLGSRNLPALVMTIQEFERLFNNQTKPEKFAHRDNNEKPHCILNLTE